MHNQHHEESINEESSSPISLRREQRLVQKVEALQAKAQVLLSDFG